MSNSETPSISREQVCAGILEIVAEMTEGQSFRYGGGPGPDTRFVADLDFKSVDMVELASAVERQFERRGLPFQDLLGNAGSDFDMTVAELAGFVHANLAR